MSRLHSHSSRSYLGRSVQLCVSSRKARLSVTIVVMGQKSAEAIAGKDVTTDGGVVAETSPAKRAWKTYPAEGPNLKRGMSFPMCSASR